MEIHYANTNLFSAYFQKFVFHGALIRQPDEHIETILNILLLMFRDVSNDALSLELNDEYEFTDGELDLAQYLTNDQKSLICKQLKSDQSFKEELLTMARNNRFYPVISMKVLTVLSEFEVRETSEEELHELMKMCENQPDDYRNCVIKLVAAHMQVVDSATKWQDELVCLIIGGLREAADTNSLDSLRYRIKKRQF